MQQKMKLIFGTIIIVLGTVSLSLSVLGGLGWGYMALARPDTNQLSQHNLTQIAFKAGHFINPDNTDQEPKYDIALQRGRGRRGFGLFSPIVCLFCFVGLAVVVGLGIFLFQKRQQKEK